MKNNLGVKLWVSFGVIFGSAALAAVGIYFLVNDITVQTDKIIADKTIVAGQTAALGNLANLKGDAPEAATYQAAMEKVLPVHDDLIGFSQWLTNTGYKRNVVVISAFQGGNVAATDAAPGTDSFVMTATGSLADLSAFLGDVEGGVGGFLLSIDSFDITNDGANYRLAASGRLFSRKQ
jgi:hypothetical protein